MQAARKKTAAKNSTPVLKSVKGAVYALVITITSILALALIVKETGLESGVISIVNQAIKIISIFTAAFIASREAPEKQLISGAVAGMLYIVFGYFTFSLIEGEFGDINKLFIDILMGLAIGVITSLIFSKLKAPEKRRR